MISSRNSYLVGVTLMIISLIITFLSDSPTVVEIFTVIFVKIFFIGLLLIIFEILFYRNNKL